MANVRGAAGSSYRSELMSIVSALRELTGLVWRGLRAGAVFHWTDNESICLFMLRRGVASMRSWRDRCCRDLWAEIRGRLNVWARAGGTWCSSWVKGHVDKEEAAGRREVGQRSVAEELNIQADDIATVLLRGEEGDKMEACEGALSDMPGGRWSHVSSLGTERARVVWMDSFSTSFRVAVEQVAIRRYWQQRVEGRVVKGSDKQTKAQAVAENPFPHIDTRLVRWGSKPTKARKPVDIFKSKLWWNHLPSLHVRSRGKRKVGQEEEGVVEEKEEGGDGGGRQ